MDDEYTIVTDDGDKETFRSKTSHVSHMTFANLAKNIKGERSNLGFAMIQQFLQNFQAKFARLDDED